MRNKKHFIYPTIIIVLTIFTGLFISGQKFACAQNNPINAKMNGDMPVGHFTTEAMDLFASKVKEYTNGGVIINTFPAQQLFSDKTAMNALAKGSIEFAETGSGGEIESLVPQVVPLAGPTYIGTVDWFYRFLYDKKSGGGWIEKVFSDKLEGKNIKFIGTILYSPSFSVMTNEKVNTIKDYQGLRLRSASKGYASLLRGLGAKPMVMSSSDVYMAVQRGTIEGGISGCTSFVARKWYEVADYAQVLNAGPHSFLLVANLDFWNKLSEYQQEKITKAAKEMEIWAAQQAIDGRESAIETLKEKGVDVTRFEVGTELWANLKKQGWDNVRNEILKKQLGDTYSQTMKMIDETKGGSTSWKEAIQNHTLSD